MDKDETDRVRRVQTHVHTHRASPSRGWAWRRMNALCLSLALLASPSSLMCRQCQLLWDGTCYLGELSAIYDVLIACRVSRGVNKRESLRGPQRMAPPTYVPLPRCAMLPGASLRLDGENVSVSSATTMGDSGDILVAAVMSLCNLLYAVCCAP